MHEPCLTPSELPFLELYRLVNRIMREAGLSPEAREGLIAESYGKYLSLSSSGRKLAPEEYRRILEETAANRFLTPANAEEFVFELLKHRN
jgi:hypothetical protein